MNNDVVNIKEGITLHTISTNKFKTNVIAIFLSKKLERENITKEALIPAVLRLGTNNIKTQKELNKYLEEMYGANFNCGIEKRGDNHVLKFYIETINDDYSLNNEPILQNALNLLIDIVFNPLTENDFFSKKYVEGEKENLKRIIESRIDNKRAYAYTRCIEEMYKNQDYGLYEYGYIDDLERIDEKNLYEYYKQFINECKIDIFVSGSIENDVEDIIENNEEIKILRDRTPIYVQNSNSNASKDNVNEVVEKMKVAQGNIVIGIDIEKKNREAINIYNAILGGGANSKLFQNVREKASLAYTAGSRYLKTKNAIFITCRIEISNYEKAISLIKDQLDEIREGKFNEEDIGNAKELLVASLNAINDEQTSEISYRMSQELSGENESVDETIQKIKAVNKEAILEVAQGIKINTIYFLTNN